MDITYELRRRLPNSSNDYLSNRVKNEKDELSLDKKTYKELTWEFIKRHWSIILVLVLIPFIFILIPHYTGIFDFQSANDGINGTKEFLKSTFAVPLSLIGIIIPITVLIIEFLGRMSDRSLIKTYLKILDPFRAFFISIAFLALSTFLFFLSMMGYNLTNGTMNYYFCIGFISIFIPVVITVILVSKTIRLIDDNFLYELMREKMMEEITNSLHIEIDDQLVRRILDEECHRLDMAFEPWFYRKSFVPLSTNRIGLIKDINLVELENFGNIIRELSNAGDTEIMGVITKYPGQFVSNDDNILGYINADENIVLNMAIELDKAFIISEGG